MKKILLTSFFSIITLTLFSQVGIGTTSPDSSSVLEVKSTTKGFLMPRLTVAERDLIVSGNTPATGLMVYNIDDKCLNFYDGTAWQQIGCPISSTSNGTSVISGFTCNTATAGVLIESTPLSGVTQTITATVTTIGTYDISITANGVTFSGSGTFAATGSQDIVLTATGTPLAAGITNFILNTTPNCNFDRTIEPPATVTGSACSAISASSYRGNNGSRYSCTYANTSTSGGAWGTDIYTDDSTIVTAAVHAGVITAGSSGTIIFRIQPGLSSYTASTQNGVTSSSYGSWSGSFDFN